MQQDVRETEVDADADMLGDEIPFVPAPQRQIKTVVDDSIVVVGQMKQKKRKRAKPTPSTSQEADLSRPVDDDPHADGGQTGARKHHLVDTPEQEPFDFSSVPNILDEISITEEGAKPRKKKKQKRQEGECYWMTCVSFFVHCHSLVVSGGVFEYGDFPAPPRAHRETKSGNQSYTFR